MSSYDNEIVQRIIKETIDMENLLCELTGEGESDTAREMRSVLENGFDDEADEETEDIDEMIRHNDAESTSISRVLVSMDDKVAQLRADSVEFITRGGVTGLPQQVPAPRRCSQLKSLQSVFDAITRQHATLVGTLEGREEEYQGDGKCHDPRSALRLLDKELSQLAKMS
jgi:hypothetical protein